MRIYIYLLALSIFFLSCEQDHDEYVKENEANLLQLFSDTNKVEADGQSQIKVTALIQSDASFKTISFQTTRGSFLDNGKSVTKDASFLNDSLSAKIYLKPSLESASEVQVTASIKELTKSIFISFVEARPDSLNLESPIAEIKSTLSSELPLEAQLFRKIGIPSLHQRVSFFARKENRDSIGEFRAISPNGSDSNGIVKAIFVLKDSVYVGKIMLIASATSKIGAITDSTLIYVTKK